MLRKRLITVLLLLPILILAILFDEPLPWLTIAASVCGLLAAIEFYRAVKISHVEPLTYFGIVWTLLLIISPHCDWPYVNLFLLATAVVLPLLWLLIRRKKGILASWTWTVIGIVYIGWLLSHLVALRELEAGRDWVLFALFVTFASDSAAFFIGRAFGKQSLAPEISPKKTVEGAIGGIAGAVIMGLLLAMLLDLPISYLAATLLAITVSFFGQIGDLLESIFKRNMGIKDSGTAMPGHGGLLDRLDSVIFAVVVVYYYVIWLVQ